MATYQISITDAEAFVHGLGIVSTPTIGVYYDPLTGLLTVPDSMKTQADAVHASLGPARNNVLISYAQNKQNMIASGGISVNVGPQNAPQFVKASTDAMSLALLMGALLASQSNLQQIFPWVQTNGITINLTGAQVQTVFATVTAFVQSTFSVCSAVIAGINAGTITSKTQVDTPPQPIAAWPVNT